MRVRWWRCVLGGTLLGSMLAASAAAQIPADDGTHLGVTSCASDNCHGRVKPLDRVRVQQDEYLTWQHGGDKHSQAYKVLQQPLALRIAKNLDLPDAEHQKLCLDCHADNVPKERQGPQFDLTEGVGCEACHGGAVRWLGIHIAGRSHADNVEHGMVATEKPEARAGRCLACHVGDDKRFVTHQIMGAGHPPMPFELATYSQKMPPHWTVNQAYIDFKFKGQPNEPNDMQMWAVGLAEDVSRRMQLLLDPKNAPKGINPELSLFDCQACHHAMSKPEDLQWRPRASMGLPPGRIKLYDATAVMLWVVAERIAPDAARSLHTHLLALHQATGKDWNAVTSAAAEVQKDAIALVAALNAHDFGREDAKALATAVSGIAIDGVDLDYSGAQQEYDALRSIVTTMGQLGFTDRPQIDAWNEALDRLLASIADDQAYRPDDFVKAMQHFKEKFVF
jgi:hypothetical protein